MTVSLPELRRLVDELALLAGAHVQGARQPQPDVVVLELRTPGQSHLLLLCAAPRRARVHLTSRRLPAPASPFAFVMKLRKELVGARVVAVRQVGDDRVVAVDVERGPRHPQGAARLTLLAELSAHHPNLFLLDAAGTILATLTSPRSAKRALRTGSPYEPPLAHDVPFTEADRTAGAPSPSAALDRLYEEREAAAEHEDASAGLRRALRSRLQRERRKAAKIEQDLARAEAADEDLRRAELVSSNLHAIEPGATVARVTDWWDPALPTLEVALDPALSVRGWLDRTFHQARRRRAAADGIRERLAKAHADVAALQEAERDLEAAATADDLAAAEATLRRLGVAPRPPQAAHHRSEPEARQPYTQLTACDGSAILVGRGARDNDTLTFQVARADDWWLHARGRRGAHVILRVARGAAPSEAALAEAALLAAWHCEGGARDTLVEVAATPRRLVRKPPGAPAGTVTFSKARTILVTPDGARVAAIRERSR